MYLLRLPNSVYYTRIATPHSLHSRGYPKEIRFSLFTKEKRIACLRNVDQTKIILSLFEHANAQDLPFVEFKLSLNEQINQLREQFNQKTQGDISAQIPTLTNCSSPQKHSSEVDTETLEDFIQSKSVEGVTALTLKQLRQRCRDFLLFVENQPVPKMTSKLAMAYRDELLSRDLSLKTIKDYIAAIKQFLSWCVVQELLEYNPFSNVKLPSKPASSSSQRPRWGMQELKSLFQGQSFKSQSTAFRWTTLVMFYQGCRPSEACQLKIKNIHLDEDIPFIHCKGTAQSKKAVRGISAGDRSALKRALRPRDEMGIFEKAMVELALGVGLAPDDLAELEIAQFDFRLCRIQLGERTIELAPTVASWLENYISIVRFQGDCTKLFATRNGQVAPIVFKRHLKRLVTEAGVDSACLAPKILRASGEL